MRVFSVPYLAEIEDEVCLVLPAVCVCVCAAVVVVIMCTAI